MPDRAEAIQAEVLRAYTVLCSVRPDGPVWGGALILNIGLDTTGSAISFAANIAGAVSLTLEPDPTLLRNALRAGSCDFVVNTLDEALRVIKNEIRKRRPLSVGLECIPSTALEEIVDRGVAPELFTMPAAYPEAAAHFRSLGALLISFDDQAGKSPDRAPVTNFPTAASVLEAFLASRPWQLHSFSFTTAAELRAFDARALALFPVESESQPDTPLRRQWLLAAARIFPRERHRTLWLTEQENQTFETPPA